MSIGTTVIELRVFNKKEKKKKNMDKMGKEEKHGQNGKTVTILAKSCILVKDLVHSLVL